MMPRYFRFLAIVIVAFLLAACGFKFPFSSGGGVSSLEDAKSAIIQIEARGSFVDPEVGLMLNVGGRGSGFIIDPSGIAVTNNHVVTGAATIQVWVGGEDEPYNARVLGVSECSDLAVIDIEGEGFPYLEWFEGDINVGTDVYAAGFPLGDPEFTLTRGIVSKERTDGETSWASVDNVIEHDATINPGNSGGPLVTTDGEVVGVNYRGSTREGTQTRFFAVGRDEALKIIDALRSGEDVTSIGVNGTAVNDGESLSGIWVSSVKSGSPADIAGIEGGDIIITLEGLVLATDYTLSDYCDILRTHDPSDTLDIEVLRFSTGEFLEGQINGRVLETTYSFGDQATTTDTTPPTQAPPPPPPPTATTADNGEFMVLMDDYSAILVAVPNYWDDYTTAPWKENGDIIGASVWASSDMNAFTSSWDVAGVGIEVSSDLATAGGIARILDIYQDTFSDQCDFYSRNDFENEVYQGQFDIYNVCGGSEGPMFVIYSLVPKDDPQSYLAILKFVLFTEKDVEAVDAVLNFVIIPAALP